MWEMFGMYVHILYLVHQPHLKFPCKHQPYDLLPLSANNDPQNEGYSMLSIMIEQYQFLCNKKGGGNFQL